MKKFYVPVLLLGLVWLPTRAQQVTQGNPPAADEVTQLRQAVQQLYRYVQYLDGEVRTLKQFIDAAVEIKLSFDVKDLPQKGKATAPIAILEFSDFQCPYCATFANNVAPTLDSLVTAGVLKKVFVDLPLTSIHPLALKAAKVGRCANEQGKFWEVHDAFFKNQGKLQSSLDSLGTFANKVGADGNKLQDCVNGPKYDAAINQTIQMAEGASISSTPTLVLGYTQPDGSVKVAKFIRGSGANFVEEIKALSSKLQPQAATPAEQPKGKRPRR
ncbi:MAG: thioredoxin domain-containing protein [Bacteroidetes Order II. Incertae sedis bacterium]|nr:thioredoxin domain-containing protein [Bacteroidetes Order II. bacterium]